MAKLTFTSFLMVGLILSVVDSASIARLSVRELQEVFERVAREDSYSFFKDFGKTKVGGYKNKDNDGGGFNATHEFDNGKGQVSGKVDWNDDDDTWSGGVKGHYKSDNGFFDGKVDGKDGKLKGGFRGNYTSDDGKTRFGGHVNFDDDGNPNLAFTFNSGS
ncbi:hypothetical protein BsWGS_27169 [Bradybaena similaris]